MADVTLSVVAIAQTSYCVASEDGESVYEAIRAVLVRHDRVRLSFEGVEDLTSAFLNSAVGQLYADHTEEELRRQLLPPEGSPEHLALLKRVVDRAKEFFRDPERFHAAAAEVFGG